MTRPRKIVLMLASSFVVATSALGQKSPPASAFDPTPTWNLDSPKRAGPPQKKAPARRPADNAASEERAARLAAARKRFFDNQPASRTDQAIPEFGGYNGAATGGTGLRPGATFKF